MRQNIEFLVCVRCFTYNHVRYIEDALNGFCMQRTSFPYVCTIVDDASTDGEPEIIRKYLNENFDCNDSLVARNEETNDYILSFARHKTNKNCYFAVLFLKYNHHSIKKTKLPYIAEWSDHVQYHALCEGDDYWIDVEKLQNQVSFLEDHSDYTICATNALILWEKGEKVPSYFRRFYKEGDFTMSQLIGNWAFATASLVYRKTVLDSYPEWTKRFYFGDMSLMLIAAHYGKFRVLSKVSTVYRKSSENETSITISLSEKMDYVNQQQVLLYEAFNEWTNGVYSDIVLNEIIRRKKEVRYYQYRKIGRLVPYITMPLYMISKRLRRNG